MWSDTFLLYERAHLQRLLLWGVTCAICGLVLLAVTRRTRLRSALLFHFGLQTAAWGLIDLVLAGNAWRALGLRDLQSAAQLDRFLWLNVGLDVGYIATGATLTVAAWLLGRRAGGIGAGIAIVAQGVGLLLLDARFLSLIDPFV
ncbi:MAG TPA: hypothetical protein VNB89_03550 [Gemmatimonadaceae bacterium]|jgi:hypothetical protein|nr:hypothetical protein [Gemmatimonadaceae bacterium]